jgi:hypothetical protein
MFRGGDVALSFCASVGTCRHERQAAGNSSSATWRITAVFMMHSSLTADMDLRGVKVI